MAQYLVAHYLPTALFSLKDSQATNAAGKTLLVPSPYAIKMALLDVAARSQGLESAKAVFLWLKGLSIRVSPPEYACVSNTFIKIQRPPKNPEPNEPFKPTIAFREYAQYVGELRLAFAVQALSQAQLGQLTELLLRINYFGKRGCFMQFTQTSSLDVLDASFVFATGDTHPHTGSVMHYLDDFGSKMTWDKLDVYHKDKPDRTVAAYLLPYQLKRSSKRSSLYQRLG
jgi:hypothetical protein